MSSSGAEIPLISKNANVWGRYPTLNDLARAVVEEKITVLDFSVEDLTRAQSVLVNWNDMEEQRRSLERGAIHKFLHDALGRQHFHNEAAAAATTGVTSTTTSSRTSVKRASLEISETVVCSSNTVNNNPQDNSPDVAHAHDSCYFGDVSAVDEEDTEEIVQADDDEIQFLGRYMNQTPPQQHQLHESFFDEEDVENIEEEDRFSTDAMDAETSIMLAGSSLTNFAGRQMGTHEW